MIRVPNLHKILNFFDKNEGVNYFWQSIDAILEELRTQQF